MYSALYYPHTTISDPSVLKTALLLWDRLEFIVPRKDHRIRSSDNNPDVDEALDLVGVGHYPTYKQQEQAHQLIEDLVTSKLPTNFLLAETKEDDRYLVYPQKFLPQTWQVLRDTGLAIPQNMGDFEDWVMSRNLGLAIMSILADSCAGTEKRTITDKASAYRLLTTSIGQLHGGNYGRVSDSVERLVTVSLRIIDAEQFSLSELITLRQKENGKGGHRVRQMRHNFLKNIDQYIQRIAKCDGNESDVREIERQYEVAMKDDFGFLCEELKRKATDVVGVKEVGIGILAAAGVAVTPWTLPSALLGIIALVQKAKNYREERKDVFSKRAMSWLFQLRRKRLIEPY